MARRHTRNVPPVIPASDETLRGHVHLTLKQTAKVFDVGRYGVVGRSWHEVKGEMKVDKRFKIWAEKI